ncbi:MAG: hypothetical protein LQ338_005924 [Usnochroma carphineum]|nr:MAG: hypothetical protein LQ338_005924 [Usnochroma carphineum]
MSFSRFLLLALLSLRTLAEDAPEEPTQSPNLAVHVSTSFPSSEIFGVKLINNHPTLAVLSISNDEPSPISVVFIGGSLWTVPDLPTSPPTPQIVRNLTTTRYDVQIPAGEKESVEYRFTTELHPQEFKLNLAVVVTDDEGTPYTLPAFNETVAVVEPDTSIFDPQMCEPQPPFAPLQPLSPSLLPPKKLTPQLFLNSIFLYLFLLALFAGTIYFIYSTWIAALFPQKKRSGGKDASRARKSTSGSKKVDPADQVGVAGADGPAATSGAKAASYDESWIPEGHLQRPEARRVKSGAGAGRKRV